MVNHVSTYIKGTQNKSAQDLSNDAYAMFVWICFSYIFYKHMLMQFK